MAMGMERLSLAAHGLAVLSLGLMAGFFGTYAVNVAPAMQGMEAMAYTQTQAALNRHVRHGLFFSQFFGPVLWCALAAAAGWRQRRQAWWWLLLAVGLAYGLGVVVFTREVNLPLNRLTEAWADTGVVSPQWTQVRQAWNTANAWRAGASLVLFATALAALAWRLNAGAGAEAGRSPPWTPTAAARRAPTASESG